MYKVICWVLLQSLAGQPYNHEVQLQGLEIAEKGDNLIVYFPELGQVLISNNACSYTKDQVKAFNNRDSSLTEQEQREFVAFSLRTVGRPSKASYVAAGVRERNNRIYNIKSNKIK